MVTLGALWLPVVVSAALVFVASSVVWMALPHHRDDFSGVPDEGAVREALSGPHLTPGQYRVPHAPDRETWESDEMQRRLEEGPVAFVTVVPAGRPSMAKQFVQWFVFAAAVSAVSGYVAAATLPAGAEYLEVFRVTGTVAWVAYGWAYLGDSVWFGRPWGFTVKMVLDALLYGLLTAGVFGWLWPA